MSLEIPENIWAVIWGGGEENVPENALSRKFWTPPKELLVSSVVDFVQEKTERGVENVPYEGGVHNPFLGGVSFVR